MNSGIDLSPYFVLIADDTSMMRAMHKKHLVQMGFKDTNIKMAEDGSQAIQFLTKMVKESMKPAIIISDWDMPIVTGLEFLKHVRSTAETRDIPFMMVTGHEKPEDYPVLAKSGVNGIILKPFKEEVYHKKITDVLVKKLMSF